MQKDFWHSNYEEISTFSPALNLLECFSTLVEVNRLYGIAMIR